VFVEFQAAMQASTIYINGTLLTTHYGGYASFTVDITPYAKFDGTNNVLAAQLDNRPNADIPPGKSTPDFEYYGGLYRDVILHITDNIHVTDPVFANKAADGGIFVTYPQNVTTASAAMQVKTNVKNENSSAKSCKVRTTIVDSAGIVVAVDSTASQSIAAGADYTFTQTITVNSPKLWNPNHPTLYKVYSEVSDGTAYLESFVTTTGIRRIQCTTSGFFINGERMVLSGGNRHQEYFVIGNAVPNSIHYRDAILMREAGMTLDRAAHYPQDPDFLDACDQLGIMVIAPTSGWQYFGGTVFQQRSVAEIRDMVRRDRNHPCIALWESSLNESGPSTSYLQSANTATHQEYPGDQCYTVDDWGQGGSSIMDVTYKECSSQTKPLFTREYGDNWTESATSTTGVRSARKYGELDMLNSIVGRQQMYAFGGSDWCGVASNTRIGGYALWSFNDYNRAFAGDPAFSGIVDIDRYPKLNYYLFASQRDPALSIRGATMGPMVKIVNFWTSSSPLPVRVCSNCQQVKLFVNDVLVATQSPDAGFAPLPHPMFSFQTTWKTGVLRADGLINNIMAVSDTVRTPGTADHLRCIVDSRGIPTVADGSDAVMMYIEVCDANNTIVPTAANSITVNVTGQGTLVGDGDSRVGTNPVTAEGGIAPALIRASTTAGTITATATSGSLTGSATIQTIPFVNASTGFIRHNEVFAGSPQNAIAVFTKVVGSRFTVPSSYAGRQVAVSVFSISGKLLHEEVTSKETIDLRKDFGATNSVHIVRVK
jgi:beta-galactosidase